MWNPFRDSDLHTKVDALVKQDFQLLRELQNMSQVAATILTKIDELKAAVDQESTQLQDYLDSLGEAITTDEQQAILDELNISISKIKGFVAPTE
jgi:aspartokinase